MDDEEIIKKASDLHEKYGRVASLFPWQKEMFIRLWRMAQDDDELRKAGWIKPEDWGDEAVKYIKSNVIPMNVQTALAWALAEGTPTILWNIAQTEGWVRNTHMETKIAEAVALRGNNSPSAAALDEARASAVIEWLESEEALTMISHTMLETDMLWNPEKGTKDRMFQKILAAKLRKEKEK